MWEEFGRNPDSASDWQNTYMDLMFDIIDTSGRRLAQYHKRRFFKRVEILMRDVVSGDGSIDENEFCTVCDHYGITRQESATAYKKFSNVGFRLRVNELFFGSHFERVYQLMKMAFF